MAYAENTTVSPDKTLRDIRAALQRYGASEFVFAERATTITVGFTYRQRHVRMDVPLPAFSEYNAAGARMSTAQDKARHERQIRQRWRALFLVLTAKLESIESGVETFDQAFMAQLMLSSGQTMYQWAAPRMDQLGAGAAAPALPDGRG